MAGKKEAAKQPKRIPIMEDLIIGPLSPAGQARLRGSRCRNCGEAFLGKRSGCENCGSVDMEEMPLSTRGKLYTYTVIANRPAGDYKGPDPFVPFGIGLVELPEGCRIVTPLTTNKNIEIGMELELVIDKLFDDADGNEVMAFKFKPV